MRRPSRRRSGGYVPRGFFQRWYVPGGYPPGQWRRRLRRLPVLLGAACCFLSGMALPGIIRMNTGDYAGLFSAYSLHHLASAQPDYRRIFRFIYPLRLRTLLLLWMSCYTPAGLLFHLLYFGLLSASAGLLLSLCVLRHGYEGILLFAGCLFPQWVIYGMMWRQETDFFVEQRHLQRKRRTFQEQEQAEPLPAALPWEEPAAPGRLLRVDGLPAEEPAAGRGGGKKALLRLFGMAALCTGASAAETFAASWTLRLFLRLFS